MTIILKKKNVLYMYVYTKVYVHGKCENVRINLNFLIKNCRLSVDTYSRTQAPRV